MNPRPSDYESPALTTELQGHFYYKAIIRYLLFIVNGQFIQINRCMKITCGPDEDQRTINLLLPSTRSLKIAAFISGGIDSAILYYMLLAVNQELGNLHQIMPFTVLRSEGSQYFSGPVVAHIHDYFGIPPVAPRAVGDPTLRDDQQVKSGLQDVWRMGYDRAYTGLIQQLPQHMIDWTPIPYQQSNRFKAPLHHLNKSHVIDLVNQLGQSGLFYITHTCTVHQVGRCGSCNGCRERQWGFDQLGLTDPGVI